MMLGEARAKVTQIQTFPIVPNYSDAFPLLVLDLFVFGDEILNGFFELSYADDVTRGA
jgi:hypothetical protein